MRMPRANGVGHRPQNRRRCPRPDRRQRGPARGVAHSRPRRGVQQEAPVPEETPAPGAPAPGEGHTAGVDRRGRVASGRLRESLAIASRWQKRRPITTSGPVSTRPRRASRRLTTSTRASTREPMPASWGSIWAGRRMASATPASSSNRETGDASNLIPRGRVPSATSTTMRAMPTAMAAGLTGWRRSTGVAQTAGRVPHHRGPSSRLDPACLGTSLGRRTAFHRRPRDRRRA